MEKAVSKSALDRIPVYLDFLKSLPSDKEFISATSIAGAIGAGEVQVRKDLAAVSGAGKPKVGYNVNELIQDVENFLGFNCVNHAILVGAGKLGKALLNYDGFKDYGLEIIAAFDIDKGITGFIESKPILPMTALDEICKKYNPKIGIITVPSENAQEVCNTLVENGIKAIMNFSPSRLKVPEGTAVRNENIAATLALLARHIK